MLIAVKCIGTFDKVFTTVAIVLCWGDEPRPALFKTIRNRVSPGQ